MRVYYLSSYGLGTYQAVSQESRPLELQPLPQPRQSNRMPSEEYAAASSGALKLKGVDSSSKIHKHKRKRPKPTSSVDPSTSKLGSPDKANIEAQHMTSASHEKSQKEFVQPQGEGGHDEDVGATNAGKTEAEWRYQEMRRKRLNDRLKREGIKTHKERVEELNRYLNKLSEHHDM